MRCSDLEALICDYVDGALTAAEKATVELHLASCASCRALVEDARAALSFIGKAADVEPPPALVNHLLFEVRQGAARPVRKRRAWLGRLLEPVLQPRFAMGMAMTILSFAMLARFPASRFGSCGSPISSRRASGWPSKTRHGALPTAPGSITRVCGWCTKFSRR